MPSPEDESRLETVVDEIAQAGNAGLRSFENADGSWVVSIENDDWSVVAEGPTRAKALSNLIANAKAEGRAS